MSFSRSSSLHYKIACFGLFAILLITFGPVISQVQAMLLLDHSAAIQKMSHHESMAQATTSHEGHSVPHNQKIKTSPTSHHFMSLCGYCDLVHHTPIVTFYTPIIIAEPLPLQVIPPLYLVDYRSPSYSKALSRAPPFN